MRLDWNELDSGENIEDTERHFRVFAGPGAGKTHWLVNQMRHVVGTSSRLNFGAKIACISYTNVAVEQIRSRLGDAASQAEVSTIHSFLYRFVVRPYLHVVRDGDDEPLVRHDSVDGHDEHRPRRGTVTRWLQSFGVATIPFGTMQFLRTVSWRKDGEGLWRIQAGHGGALRGDVLRTLKANLQSYKRFYWEEGIIDHEDVLYFADRIISEQPALNRFIAARFPYVLIDEFQDTNPVQTVFVRWLAEAGATVGVIGDREQSIYGFQGAAPQDFEGFDLPGLRDYVIQGNRRSTGRITEFLNASRRDAMVQHPTRGEGGEPVVVLVGDAAEGYRIAAGWVGKDERLVALAFRHDEVRLFREPGAQQNDDVWEELYEADPARVDFLQHVLRATEMGSQRMFGPAVKEALAALRLREGRVRDPLRLAVPISEVERRGIAAFVLEWAVENGPNSPEQSVRVFYDQLSEGLSRAYAGLSLTKVASGKFGIFAAKHTYRQLAANVTLAEEARNARTIHQSKGAEFDNVLLRLQSEAQVMRLCGLIGAGSDGLLAEARTYYVGASRARNRLVLSVSALSGASKRQLEAAGLRVVSIPS